jgi:Xaa-Pro aminopeptidase
MFLLRSSPMLRAFLIAFISLQAAVCEAGDNSFYKARREALMKKIEGSVAVLQGAPETRTYTAFRQDNNFYYLTGVETPNAMLLVDGSSRQSVLFLPPQSRKSEQWDGRELAPGPDAGNETGMDAVLELSRFEDELEKRKLTLRTLYIPLAPQEIAATSRDRAMLHDSSRKNDPWDGRISREEAFEKKMQAKLDPSIRIEDLSPILDEMRRVKDAREIQQLRESGRIAALGMKEAIRSARPDMVEYQIAALAEFTFVWNGASGPAFFPIVGSGPNSCVLHYSRNQRKMVSGDIAVLDLGADYRYYSSDITRTIPVSGKFSEEQAKVYGIVLEAQKAALEKIRPGATFGMIDEAARAVLRRYDYEDYLIHSVSHYIGMSNHDVGKREPFEAGVVIAVEPGVYITEKNLGIRIEDTVLVTKDGNEILTGNAPKEMPEIEKLMSEKSSFEAIKN